MAVGNGCFMGKGDEGENRERTEKEQLKRRRYIRVNENPKRSIFFFHLATAVRRSYRTIWSRGNRNYMVSHAVVESNLTIDHLTCFVLLHPGA